VTEDQKAVLTRLRRKIEIMHLDLQAQQNARYHDTHEMLALITLLETPT
jgi:hypothetical protein